MKRYGLLLAVLLPIAAAWAVDRVVTLTNGSQTLAGVKTWTNDATFDGGVTIDGGLTVVNGVATVNGDAGVRGSVSVGQNLAVDGGITSHGAYVATKLIWSTPDPLNSNASDQPTRPLNGALNGVAGSIAGVNCVPSMRGDGGGDIYVTLLDVTDGGTGNLLCSMDFDQCDLTANLVGTLGLAVETNGACNGIALSASNKYMYRLGVAIDGGATCGLHAPIMECTTIINPVAP